MGSCFLAYFQRKTSHCDQKAFHHLIDIEISLFFCSSSKTHLMDLIARPASKQKKLVSTNLGQIRKYEKQMLL
jgi:hypothetical protein